MVLLQLVPQTINPSPRTERVFASRTATALTVAFTMFFLAACGGGGDGGADAPVNARYSPKGVEYVYDGTAPVSDAYLGALLDYYVDYWTLTRTAWAANPGHVSGLTHVIYFDCTFPCRGSPNGLCAGQNDGLIEVAYYRLRRSIIAPAGWAQKRNPRTARDMYALANNDYWLNQEYQYFWCENSNPPLPALLHEWDHLLFDPHDAVQNLLVSPLPHSFAFTGGPLAAMPEEDLSGIALKP